jgi:RNA polymerase sigma-70 factor (ECF subfamily)
LSPLPTILQRIAKQDARAVEDCVDEYGGLVYRLARRYLDRAPAEVDDAVQEVFFELWRHAGRYDPAKGSEPAFVATIAHRRLTDHQRAQKSRHAAPLLGTIVDMKATAKLDGIAHRDEAKRVTKAMEALPDEERRALWLSIVHGLSHSQIAQATETPVGTIKTRLRRGIIRLREMVPNDGGAHTGTGGDA